VLACVLLPPDLPDAARRLLTVSPVIELAGDAALLDVRGTERLHGGTAGIFAALARAFLPGRPAGMGLAGNRFTAQVAARVSGQLARGAIAVEPGDEGLFLSRLPLSVLPLSAGLRRRLEPLGLETLGDLATLPVAAVSRRFGPEGVAMHALARGEDEGGLLPEPTGPALCVIHEPLHPVPDLERLADPLETALSHLCGGLAERGLGVVRLSLELVLGDDGSDRWPVIPAEPETRVELLRDLVFLALGERPPQHSVTCLTVTAEEVAPPGVHQNTLLGESARDASRRAEALTRLVGALGPGVLARPVPRRAHRTEDRWVDEVPGEKGATSAGAGAGATPGATDGPRAGGRSAAGRRAQAGAAQGATALRSRGGKGAGKAGLDRARSTTSRDAAHAPPPTSPPLRWHDPPRLLVPVRAGGRLLAFRLGRRELSIAGLSAPRRLEGGWWCDPWARDEYDLVTSDGAVYRICRDMAARRWLLLAEAD
jgi:protein ImuB